MLMGDLLEEFFARPYVAAKVAEGRLPDTWREVVGDAVANLTTDLRLENRILYVRLQSSVVRQELFYQREAAARPYQRGFEGAAGQCRHRQVRRDASAEKTVGSVHMPLLTVFCSAGFRPLGRTIRSPRFAPDSGFRFRGSPSCLLQDGIHRENRKTALRSAAFLFVSMRAAYLITTTRLFSMLPLKG